MNEPRILSVCEFLEAVFGLRSQILQERSGKLSSDVFYFRGQGNKEWELLPKLGRSKDVGGLVGLEMKEGRLIEGARQKMPELFGNGCPPIELLARLQHYGIPTRLLDVTRNPLVALYFACQGPENSDGKVFLFVSDWMTEVESPFLEALADTYRLAPHSRTSLKDFYERLIGMPYFCHYRQMAIAHMEVGLCGDEYLAAICKEVLFVHAPERFLRQKVQQGSYILFPNRVEKSKREKEPKEFYAQLDPMPEDRVSGAIMVGAEGKKDILRDLALCGIEHSTLFPEDYDGICRALSEEIIARARPFPYS